jgi:hypothetical protein
MQKLMHAITLAATRVDLRGLKMAINKRGYTIAIGAVAALAFLFGSGGGEARAASPGCNAVNSGAWDISASGNSNNSTYGNFNPGDVLTFTFQAVGPGNTWGFGQELNAGGSGNLSEGELTVGPITANNFGGGGSLGIAGGGIGPPPEEEPYSITVTAASCTPAAPPTVTSISPNYGPNYTSVTITGTGFFGCCSAGDSVNFGPNGSNSVTANSTTSITALAPPGSGTVDVTVINAAGTSAISAFDQYTYSSTPPPAPTVSGVSPGAGQAGNTVTITGTNFGGETAVEFGSCQATSVTVNSSTSITVTAPTGCQGTVDVTVTNAGGTSATGGADKFTYAYPRTWVSAISGDDSNPCSVTQPCLTFARALAATSAGGEIDVLTPGDFGPVTITQAVSIYNDQGGEAGTVVNSGTSGITINAGSSDEINLRGLIFDGANQSGTSGVVFTSGAQLHITNCTFLGFTGTGITFSPGTGSAATAAMVIQNSAITANATGISIKPSGGIAANVTLSATRVDKNNGGGVRADGTGGSGAVNVAMADSSASLNTSNGINAVSGPGNVIVNVMRSTIASNGETGVQSNAGKGGTASVTVGSSQIYGNGTGVAAVGGGSLVSYGNNHLTGNATNGGFSGMASLQ